MIKEWPSNLCLLEVSYLHKVQLYSSKNVQIDTNANPISK